MSSEALRTGTVTTPPNTVSRPPRTSGRPETSGWRKRAPALIAIAGIGAAGVGGVAYAVNQNRGAAPGVGAEALAPGVESDSWAQINLCERFGKADLSAVAAVLGTDASGITCVGGGGETSAASNSARLVGDNGAYLLVSVTSRFNLATGDDWAATAEKLIKARDGAPPRFKGDVVKVATGVDGTVGYFEGGSLDVLDSDTMIMASVFGPGGKPPTDWDKRLTSPQLAQTLAGVLIQ